MTDDKCPAGHVTYLSQTLADNALELHRLANDCTRVHSWPCGDHFHIGHTSKSAGRACKATDEDWRVHRGKQARKARARHRRT